MVYLSRTFEMVGDPDKGWDLCQKIVQFIDSSSQDVKSVEALMNIAGRQDQIHIVIGFESLAKEEEVTRAWMQGEEFINLMMQTEGLLSWPIDSLYRRLLPEA